MPQEGWRLFKAVRLGDSSVVGGDLTIFVAPCFNEMARRVHNGLKLVVMQAAGNLRLSRSSEVAAFPLGPAT